MSRESEKSTLQKNLKQKSKQKLSPAKKLCIKLLIIAISIVCVLAFVIQVRRNTGNENFASIKDGDLCIFNRLATININDIVLYEAPDGELKIGRVVAMPNQEIDIDDSGCYRVNNYLAEEEITYETKLPEKNTIKYPLKLDSNQYFILNDFRTLTSDSREYGAIDKSKIHGSLLMLFRRRGF